MSRRSADHRFCGQLLRVNDTNGPLEQDSEYSASSSPARGDAKSIPGSTVDRVHAGEGGKPEGPGCDAGWLMEPSAKLGELLLLLLLCWM